MAIQSETKTYSHDETQLKGIFFWDAARSDRRPGILVVHAGMGLDEHAKGRATRFAELGLIAFCCDMYGKPLAPDRETMRARIMELRNDIPRLVARARAGIDVLKSHPQVDGRIAAVGYCFGGMTVLELARNGADLAGVISVHGSLSTPQPAQPSAVKSKILVCHGALDPHVPMTHVSAFVEEMNQAGADYQIIIYANAMHGFTHNTGAPPTTPGVAYHALTDARSTSAITDFLGELFG